MVGRTLAHYRIVEQIGAGGMGVVYRAHDTRLDREVALKVLPPGTVLDETARRRLRNEARLLSRLNHPNIATIHDFDTADGIDYLAMELVPGVTLSERLAAGPLPPDQLATLGAQLAEGIAAAHRAGIIHRDLKPSNLRVTPDGVLKLLDFGIAQLLHVEAATTATDAAAGSHAGTLRYMAPEQLRGAEPNERTDIYSTGAVLYEMATGRPLFPERPDALLIEAIQHRVVNPPSSVNRSLPALFDVVILKALDRDPARRYHAERELAVDLRRLASGAPPVATRRRSAPVMVGLGVAAMIGVFVARHYMAAGPIVPQPDASGRLRLAILEPRNLTSLPALDGWPAVAQILIVGELTGVEKLGIMDPQSLNTLVTTRGSNQSKGPALRSLADAHVALALEGELVASEGAYTLRARLVDPSSGESRFSTSTAVVGESDLVRASRAIAEAVLMYLQLETKAGDQDLRPWIRSHSANIEAVKAFLQANADIYRATAEEEPPLQRAIALDPDFVAPRVWLAISLNGHGRPADAAAHYERLKTLLPRASPFERAMIEFTGARLAKDAAGQEQSLMTGLRYSPGNNILLFQLAGLQVVGGRCDEALQTMAPAIAMRWRYRNLYPLFGWCAIQTGGAASAEPVLREAAEFESPHPRTLAILEAIAMSNGDDAAAARYRTRYEATHPQASVTAGVAPLFSRLGRDAVAVGKMREAERLFRRAADQDPKLADPHLALGELAEASGRIGEAVGHYRDYLAFETDAAKATVIREKIARLAKLSPVPKRPNAA